MRTVVAVLRILRTTGASKTASTRYLSERKYLIPCIKVTTTHLDPVRRPRVASQRCVGDKAAGAVRTRMRQEGAVVMGFVEAKRLSEIAHLAAEPTRPLTLRKN